MVFCRAPDEYARFRINRPTVTTPTRHESNLYRDIWNLKVLHSTLSKNTDRKLYNDYVSEDRYNILYTIAEATGTVYSLDVFDGKKHIATVTEHAKQQIKELDRRFDGKKYIMIEDSCTEQWDKKIYGKKPGPQTNMKWQPNDYDVV